MDKERRTFWLWLLVAAIVIGLFAITCTSGSGSQVAMAAERSDERDTVIPAPLPIEEQAELVYGDRCNCWVWHWADTWEVTMATAPHAVQYRFGIDVQWRANASKTKVTGLVFNYCLDKGGYFNFEGCRKEHGATGYRSIGMYTVWHYTYKIAGWGIVHRDPSVRFDLWANGGVTGTVYYDN